MEIFAPNGEVGSWCPEASFMINDISEDQGSRIAASYDILIGVAGTKWPTLRKIMLDKKIGDVRIIKNTLMCCGMVLGERWLDKLKYTCEQSKLNSFSARRAARLERM